MKQHEYSLLRGDHIMFWFESDESSIFYDDSSEALEFPLALARHFQWDFVFSSRNIHANPQR